MKETVTPNPRCHRLVLSTIEKCLKSELVHQFVPKPMPFWRLLALAPLFADALDCSDRSDPVVATCCDAQSAWFSMEAAGGCGGEGATDNHCAHAAELCQRCRAAVDGTEKDGDPLLDQKLSSLNIGFLEMTCVLPQWSPCGVTPTDDTMLPLLVAGALLFLLTLGLVIFDRRVVPCVIGQRIVTEEEKCKAVDEGATSLGQSAPQVGNRPTSPAQVVMICRCLGILCSRLP